MQKNLNTAYAFRHSDQLRQDTVTASDTENVTTEKSSLVSRNITVDGHRTSVRLEPDMWNALRDICRREKMSLHDIATSVAARKPANSSLTAAIRVFVMAYFRSAATEDGHNKAGHGPGGSFMSGMGLHKHTNVVTPPAFHGGMNTVARRF